MTDTHRPLRIVVPDLVSPSYFPVIAAVELRCIEELGTAADLSLRFPVTTAVEALRAGDVDLVAGSAHTLFHAAPDGGGVRILAAISHNTYWFLVVRADLGLVRGASLSHLRGLRIGAAPGPDAGLVEMLRDAGVEPETVDIAPVKGAVGTGVSFGVAAARALADGRIDGFWANGMGAEVAVREGVGTVIVDARRGDGPPGSERYTFAALLSTERMANVRPGDVSAAVAGLVEAQRRLRADSTIATSVAERLFPPMEASLTSVLIERDAPFYDPAVHAADIDGMVGFAQRCGLTSHRPVAENLVADRFRHLWAQDS